LREGGRDILEVAEKLDRMPRDQFAHIKAGNATQKIGAAHMLSSHADVTNSLGGGEGGFGARSHYVQQAYPGLNIDSRTNSGGKKFAANSDANDSIDERKHDNWVADDLN